jgi:hypothetical protein
MMLVNSNSLTSAARQLLQRSYWLARAAHYLHGSYHTLRYQLSPKTAPILIFQMGKVGSSSVTDSLAALRPAPNVYHVHYLTQQKIDEVAGQICFPQRPIAPKDHWTSRYLRSRLEARKGERWKIITLVREPIGRNISAFFQNAHWLYPDYVARYQKGELGIQDFIQVFLESYPHAIPLTWFDDELKAVFGVDVFAEEFAKDAAARLYQGEFADVLLLKLETLSNGGVEAIKQFLNLKDFRLVSSNVGEEKDYASLYDAFKKTLVLPDAYIAKMYESKYAQHFYSKAELEHLGRKWTGKPQQVVATGHS